MTTTEWERLIETWKGRSILEGAAVVPLYQILSDDITLEDAEAWQRNEPTESTRNLQLALMLQFPAHWFEITLWVDIPGYLMLKVHPKVYDD